MRTRLVILSMAILVAMPFSGSASPRQDLEEFQNFYMKRFPDTPFEDFANGVYSIDAASRAQWQDIEEFAPYELNISDGEALFNAPFANGNNYASCFENDGIGIRQNYPFFDTDRGEVVTLELAINECRDANGEKRLSWGRGAIADISAYMAYTSRGKIIDVKIPDDPRALEAYQRGKMHFYQKRGQLNMSCADCHKFYVGNRARADLLGPALGHLTHFPVYRSGWGGLGTTHRRYIGCDKGIRAKPFVAQGKEYRALEYFQSYMSNGLAINGPGSRK
ncbi:MAG: sulfur oxidation c-type cytochrome SoxA [Gammaproteobacteria bacterium]|nr:sulfur oxidation c-type cytochrome SoxA [Gammaproteobacteria bacterium]